MKFRKILFSIFCCFISPFAKGQWIQTNGPYGGEVTAIAGDTNQIFVAAFEGGIFRSVNNGQSWTEVNNESF